MKLPTGVPGLDDILGGGLPEFSFNIIAGAPGCGKTTLAHQFVFANATPGTPGALFHRPRRTRLEDAALPAAIYFLRRPKLNRCGPLYQSEPGSGGPGLDGILEEITKEVEAANPGIVVVDSFRTVVRTCRATTKWRCKSSSSAWACF